MSEGLSWQAVSSIASIVTVGVTILAGVLGLLIKLGIQPLRDEVRGVAAHLGEIKQQLSKILDWKGDHDQVHQAMTSRLDGHEQRISALEED